MKTRKPLRSLTAPAPISDDELSAVSGGGSSGASFSDLSVVKVADKSSPALAKRCCTGKHYGEVIIAM